MALSSKSLNLIIPTLAKRLFEDENLMIRAKAAQSLGKLGSEQAIPPLCQALENEKDPTVVCAIMDAIILINNLRSAQTMSEAPKYDLRGAKIANLAETVQGDQKAVQHNYPPQQNLTEAAKEIQGLLTQLKQDNPEFSEEKLVEQVIKNNPNLKARLINALKEGGLAALGAFFPFVSIPVETIRGFLEAG